MATISYEVSFSGILAEGSDPAQVRRNLAELFKTDLQRIERLFCGKSIVIKSNLDQTSALKYQVAMRRAGAVCTIEERGSESAQSTSPSIQPTDGQGSDIQESQAPVDKTPVESNEIRNEISSASLAPAGSVLIEHEDVRAPEIDVSAISLAPQGSDLVEHTRIEPPAIDISSMTLAPQAGDLVEHKEVEAPSIDTGALDLAPAGGDLVELAKVDPFEVDTSSMSIAETGARLVEQDDQPAPPPPDTGHLSVQQQ
jgi:hypothetical protein